MELKSIIEAILFSSQKPLTAGDLREVCRKAAEFEEEEHASTFKKTKVEDVEFVLRELAAEHEEAGRTYRLICIAGAWQFACQPEYAPWIKALVGQKPRPPKLSQPALETLAIIAYRQPLTRAEMEQIRGVAVDGVMGTLIERGLVETTGKAEAPGRPSLYGTTEFFLEYFGLAGLDDLPAADELRRIVVQKPEGLSTVDAGLQTAADEESSDQEQREIAPDEGGESPVEDGSDESDETGQSDEVADAEEEVEGRQPST